MSDAKIDFSDIPELDKSFLKKATVAWPPVKKQLTIRLDADVLDWLKGHGKGYQTRIKSDLAGGDGEPAAIRPLNTAKTKRPRLLAASDC